MILQELSGTQGGTKSIQRVKDVDKDVISKKSTKKSKKSVWDTAKASYDTKKSAYDAKKSAYDAKVTAYNKHLTDEPDQYRYRVGDSKGGAWTTIATNPSKKYPRTSETNPAWTTWNSETSTKGLEKTTALSQKNTAETEKDSAESDKDTKETQYNDAVDDLTNAEKTAKAIKKATGFGFGAGAGGRAGGKGGTAKKGKGKGTKDESLFRILGRDFLNELKDLQKYKK